VTAGVQAALFRADLRPPRSCHHGGVAEGTPTASATSGHAEGCSDGDEEGEEAMTLINARNAICGQLN